MRRYIQPTVEVFAFSSMEAMLATSDVNVINREWQDTDTHTEGVGDQFSHGRGGWDSSQWSGAADGEEE